MKSFGYYQPTEIRFGRGRLEEVGEVVSRFGKRCLLVTMPEDEASGLIYAKAKRILTQNGIEFEHFDGVIPNPTTEVVSAGAGLAKEFGANVIVGLGGSSSMDTAKAIAVEAVHPGTSWDYLYFSDTQPSAKTLPIVAISTTSGTGSQVTQVAVVTNPAERNKSAVYHPVIFPKACIIDPELMITVPKQVTASTGFDVFCHAFESTLPPERLCLHGPPGFGGYSLGS
jgi:alcohol dehydrogenase class IV